VYSCERDEAHHELDVALNEFNLDAQDLTRGLVGAVGESGALTTIVSQFERALTSLSVPPEDPDTPFMASLDAIQSTVSTLNENLPMLSQVSGDRLLSTIQDLKIVDSFNAMCLAGRTAIAKADSEEARTELRAGLTSLGATLINTLQAAKNFQQNPGDYDAKKALMQSVRSSLTEITTVKNALHHSAKGVHACHNAVNSYDYLINDLATTSIFASAGSFGEANKTCDAKKLVNEMMKVANSVKTLVHSLDATQEVIVSNVNDTVKESGLLVKAVKENAAALANDSSSQVLLINAAKDLVVALRETLRITASAVGRIENSPEVKKLTEYYQKGFKDAIISFGNTSKSLQDELARGIRASEAARNALKLELENIDAYKPPAPSPPEKILSTSSEVIQVTASLISAVLSQNQQQTTESANNTRKAVIDLLRHTKGASVTEDLDPNDTEIAINSSKLVAKAVLDMLETGALKHLHAPTEESKKSLAGHSQSIAEAVAALTAAARGLKGADFVDPNDPQAIAEKELTVAAIMIEEAAKKLAAMRPKETITFTQEMKFEDLIVNAAQQITAAASSLISAAQSAQAELKKKGRLATKIGEARYHEDAAWSEGLVSAAKEVGVATSMLCDAANSCVQGVPDSDLRMIAAAKAVSASTQRLLHACRARAECGSKEMHNLDNAGAAVVKATNALVKSAQESMAGEAAPLMDTGAIKDKLGLEMSLQIKILQREKEVETARRELERYRKMKYQK
jgi:talin